VWCGVFGPAAGDVRPAWGRLVGWNGREKKCCMALIDIDNKQLFPFVHLYCMIRRKKDKMKMD